MTQAPSFWDRRRAAVRAEADAEAQRQTHLAQTEAEATQADLTDDELLEALDLPDPDTLGAGDDFTAFMAKAVPHHLRNRALRKLWRSNPVLACVDGLNDYDDDYLTGSFGNAPIKTGYQVGKGMMAHLIEMQRQAEAAAAAASDDPDTTPDPAVQAEPLPAVTAPEPSEQHMAEAEVIDEPDEDEDEHVSVIVPRRMQFTFEEDRA
ncbi:DUF3306 domain-containing protein [Sulfitobacter sabulilitoris]|uniref:DUF3306 domain-containing protein n=1 Tax=Sulfitobacter sabulilitoris TaxID=2562655 RepID=A0A5S3PBL5_9RHOB|nr:DUF3306 domain-containing protein [Sulfitobacter sabulilitoris]TMM51080.1 DUF3306 domain-containing protein [Sulfitobacter sabulilitoris]